MMEVLEAYEKAHAEPGSARGKMQFNAAAHRGLEAVVKLVEGRWETAMMECCESAQYHYDRKPND